MQDRIVFARNQIEEKILVQNPLIHHTLNKKFVPTSEAAHLVGLD